MRSSMCARTHPSFGLVTWSFVAVFLLGNALRGALGTLPHLPKPSDQQEEHYELAQALQK